MSFFGWIQRASIEKCHSAAIGWFFSDENSFVNADEKRRILSNIALAEIGGSFRSVMVEYKGIDIIVEYDNSVVAFENKVKISEHDQQLHNYDKILTQEFPNKKVTKIFLSLIGEASTNRLWKVQTYAALHSQLQTVATRDESIRDYVANLSSMVGAVTDFQSDHRRFPGVFLDGSKTKLAKREGSVYSGTGKYISENGLETILQKEFFHRICNALQIDCRHKLIGETRGNALINLKNPECQPTLLLGSEVVDIGIQIQGVTIKLQFENGLDSTGKWKPKNSTKLAEVLRVNIPRIYLGLNLKAAGWRLNPPKRNSQSEYYSISREILFPGGKNGYFSHEFEECRSAVQKSIDECLDTLDQINRHLTLFST